LHAQIIGAGSAHDVVEGEDDVHGAPLNLIVVAVNVESVQLPQFSSKFVEPSTLHPLNGEY